MPTSWEIILSVFSGICVPPVYWLAKRISARRRVRAEGSPLASASPIPLPVRVPSYREELGERLARLRRDILRVEKRRMADFLGLETVTELENFEAGRDELPKALVGTLANGLHINRDYLERGTRYPFRRFNLRGIGDDELGRLLDSGYEAVALRGSEDPADADAYDPDEIRFALVRRGGPIPAVVLADVCGRLDSTGGGRMNIECMLRALIERGRDPESLSCYRLPPEEWKRIEDGTYYDQTLPTTCRAMDIELLDELARRSRRLAARSSMAGTTLRPAF